jgi:hypothetical protein
LKKIKKILPVLLGVMVLMFGTLTVSAKGLYAFPDGAYDTILEMCEKQNVTLNQYRFAYRDSQCIFVVSSDVPLTYKEYKDSTSYDYQLIGSGQVVTVKYIIGNNTISSDSHFYSGLNAVYLHFKEHTFVSDYDITDAVGNIMLKKDNTGFFPVPPVAKVAEGLPVVVRSQIKVILITAVACLALLVILSVLPKKLPRFLNR